MKKDRNKIDDAFRDALEDYQIAPSEESREAFFREAPELLKKTPPGRKLIFFISLSVLVLIATIGGTGYYFLNRKTASSEAGRKEQSIITSPTHKSNTVPDNNIQENKNEIPANKTTTSTTLNTPLIHTKNTLNSPLIHPETIPNTPLIHPESQSISSATTLPESPAPNSQKPETSSIQESIQPSSNIPSDSSVLPPDTLILPGKPDQKKSAKNRNLNFSIGIQYNPELMFNLVNDGQKFVNNFGLEGAFRLDRFSVRTGIGLSITKGSTEVANGYEKYLGSFNKLDSITFAWNSQNYQYIPTIYTTLTNVYDTMVRYTTTRIEKRYTYLQIPLILGYDFLVKEKIRMGLRAGPIVNFLLNEKQLTSEYDPGKDRIIRVNNVTPDRIQTNWQVVGGLNVSVVLNRKLTIEIEPEVKYYFNSVYEKSDITKKPWSAGIRIAFLLNFIR